MARELTVIDEREIRSEHKFVQRSGMHGSGAIVKVHSSVRPDKHMCNGCREDFYNGHNDLGVKECWMFRDAQVVDKVGHSSIHVCGGPDTKMVKTLSCWRGVRK